MRLIGQIEKLDKIIVSDPSYSNDVSCRYERNNLEHTNWKIEIEIHPYKDEIDGITIEGIDFFILLQDPKQNCILKDNGSFSYYSENKINEIEIGIDTACIALGINNYADTIKNEKDTWQPKCALNTLSDGLFGSVKEGTSNEKINFIWISGFLDKDTDYSIDDLTKYFETQFNISNLQKTFDLVESKEDIDYDI